MSTQLQEKKAPAPGGEVLLEARGLTKSYGQVQALRDGSAQIRAGRVTAIIGDNGAGKSTLVGCLSGMHSPSGGDLEVDGKVVQFGGPQHARSAGIETVYQDLALVDTLRVWQNLYLGREDGFGRGPLRWLKRRAMREEARRMVGALAVNVPSVDARVLGLSGGQRQAVALAGQLDGVAHRDPRRADRRARRTGDGEGRGDDPAPQVAGPWRDPGQPQLRPGAADRRRRLRDAFRTHRGPPPH